MEKRLVITGAAGFIGSCLAQDLYRQGYSELILVDDFTNKDKASNLNGLEMCEKINRKQFLDDLDTLQCDFIFHIGARTDTTEFDEAIFDELNLSYSKKIWEYCVRNQTPLIYASSAATYGDGQLGFNDDEATIPLLKPLNPYGYSKQHFDEWVLNQRDKPPFWVGLKFFNVFGPNEYHKGRMASVIYHAYNQIKDTGAMRLFASHNPDYKDGEQLRDFIYIKDLLNVVKFWYHTQMHSGIYNLGTGQARSFNDLVLACFAAMDMAPNISYIPTPIDIRDTYQYYTEARMKRTTDAGYSSGFMSLEEAVFDYISNYLSSNSNF